MRSINKIISDALFESEEVDASVIAYYKKNPDELDLLTNKHFFNSIFLATFFVLGIVLTVLSKVIQYAYAEQLGPIVSSIILEVLSELGIAIFGGAVTAYLLNFFQKRQYQKNLKYQRKIKRLIAQSEAQEADSTVAAIN